MSTPSAPPEALAPDLIERFRVDHAAVDRNSSADAPLLVAVSGGVDSLALLLLTRGAFGRRCHAATVDHQLRPASKSEAAFVAGVCTALGVPHVTLRGQLATRVAGTANVSQRARELRYRLLAAQADAIGAGAILTGHHADDQLETLVMRLNRASGLAGLAGIRSRNGRIVRPLLGWTRAELADVVRASGFTPVDDPSNRDDRFDRARLRKMLADSRMFDAKSVAQSMAALEDANAALDEIAQDRFESIRGDGTSSGFEIDTRGLPDEILRRVVQRCVAALDPAAVVGRGVLRRIGSLEPGEKVSVGSVLVQFVLVPIDTTNEAFWPVYTVGRAPPRRASVRVGDG